LLPLRGIGIYPAASFKGSRFPLSEIGFWQPASFKASWIRAKGKLDSGNRLPLM